MKRPATTKYWEWSDIARKSAGVTDKVSADFFFGIVIFVHCRIPKSYSKKKRQELEGKFCQTKPDTDNVLKALCDSLFSDDEKISIMHGYKYWAYDDEEPRIDVFLLPNAVTKELEG